MEAEVEDALRGPWELETDIVVAHVAFDRRQRQRVGLLDNGIGFIDEREVAFEQRGAPVDGGDEAGHLIEFADEQTGEGDERDDLADGQLAASSEDRTGCQHGDHGDGRRRALQHGEQAPPGEHRILRGEQIAHHRAHGVGLGFEPGEALHHRHVGDDIADATVDGEL